MEYIRVTKDYNRLEADEMNIISGIVWPACLNPITNNTIFFQ